MLNKKHLIGNRRVIEALFKKGKIFKSELLIFKYEKSSGNTSQFAVSVSKKIYKKANKRNHLRRQIQEALRLNLQLLKKNFVALVVARPMASDRKELFRDLNENVKTFFKTIQQYAE